jgi:hypothetical protein
MENAGILQLLAELALGVLGFSGVVAVLGHRSAGEWAPIDRFRFFTMIRVTALVLLLAVLPFPFHSAGFASQPIWGWCSGVGAILLVCNGVAMRLVDRPPKGTFTDPKTSRLATAYVVTAIIGAPILFAMNATGIGLDHSATPYLVAVLLTFGVPVVLFIRLLYTAIGPGRAYS